MSYFWLPVKCFLESSVCLHSKVLDIETKAVLPDEFMPLTLRPPDGRRRLTQHWRFTPEGRLCCKHENLCVQAKDGFQGIDEGSPIV
jgi:vacuolar protein sorting-associated protein 13D